MKSQKGSSYIELILSMCVIMAIIFSFTTIPEIYIKKQNIDYIASQVARLVEISGEINDNTYAVIEELSQTAGITPTVAWEGNFINGKIQIRERFNLTLSTTVRIKIITPSFTAPVYIEVPIRKKVSGISEVYWKGL